MSSYRHQISYVTGRTTNIAHDDPSEQRNENNPDNSSDAATSLTFRFDVHHKVQFKMKPLHQPEILLEEQEAPVNRKFFRVNICHSTNCNSNINVFRIVSRILSELEIEQHLHDPLIEQISPSFFEFAMEAKATSEHKRMTLVVEIRITDVYEHDEEETIAMAEMESAEDNEQRGFGLVPASKSAIEKLARVRFNGEDFTAMMSCRICLEEMEIGSEVTRMPCSHVYHRSCVSSWLEINHVCPLCRFEMPI